MTKNHCPFEINRTRRDTGFVNKLVNQNVHPWVSEHLVDSDPSAER